MSTSGEGTRLGELLIADAGLSRADLGRGLALARGNGLRLGSALVALEIVSADTIATALAKQHGVAAARDKHLTSIAPEVRTLISAATAKRLCAIPVGILRGEGAELVVAMRDPKDKVAIAELERESGHKVRPAVACEGRLRELVDALKDESAPAPADDPRALDLIDLAALPPMGALDHTPATRPMERIDLTPPPAPVGIPLPAPASPPKLELPPTPELGTAGDLELAAPIRPRTPSHPPPMTGMTGKSPLMARPAVALPPVSGGAVLDEPRHGGIIIPGWIKTVVGLAISGVCFYFAYNWAAHRGDDGPITGPAVHGTFHSDRVGASMRLAGANWHDQGGDLNGQKLAELGDSVRIAVFMRGDEMPPDAVAMVARINQQGAFPIEVDPDVLRAGLDNMEKQASSMSNGLFTLEGLKCRVDGTSPPVGACDGNGSVIGDNYQIHFYVWIASTDDALMVIWFDKDGGADDARALVDSIRLD